MEPTITAREECIVAQNGIPIYHCANRHLHSFCLGLYLRAGSLYEPDDANGATHLWEHALYRKMNALYGGDFYRELDRLGLEFSACTYKEFLYVKVTGAPVHFRRAADMLARVFEPMVIPAAELELEKKRIKAEIREGDERTSLDYFTGQIIWQGTSLANTITGKHRVLDRIGVRALGTIQDDILALGNVFVYVTGCFGDGDIHHLSQALGTYVLPAAGERRRNLAPRPAGFFRRGAHVAVKNSPYHYVRFSFDVDVARYTMAELDLIYNILFSGETSKLFQELSEKTGYIYGFDARFERYVNLGSLYFSFDIAQKHILPAVRSVVDILNGMKGALTDELALTLAPYTTNAPMLLDDADELNWTFAYERHIMNAPYLSLDGRRQAYESVTTERLMQVAREIFVPDHAVLTLKTDKKRFDTDEARTILLDLET